MTKIRSSPTRNVENIRQRNLEDNQLFLQTLHITEIRNGFLQSARSILRKKENTKIPIKHEKIEYLTRHHVKVKSGEIAPYVPEWQRKIERKKLNKEQQEQEKERRRQQRLLENERRKQQRLLENERTKQQRLLEKERRREAKEMERQEKIKIRLAERRRRRRELCRWYQMYKHNANPYQRVFQPRQTKIDERIKQEYIERVEQKNL